ncbi:CDC48 family AAA ATPase [Altererythrobacter ishigakiensis]|uniref:Transitional endoplasmic reticulum ATPase n=1 Tax=Altererythrobacter ishigakiensis TaxID=476157 RepID=A0A562US49_9SPHN|nr:CDC48 family AAA ATPase [Altererythrobacter ishigakiensis]MDX1702978.1 CDC48 family AAA ATPase [Altererythrobacter ishigakiensis]TWJ08418.1 transitional endoplasmic reticulum ATPase [Altererythrobacter ishigakiensis]
MADADPSSKKRNKKEEKSVRLQVAAARQEESGQGIARLPRSAFQELGITEGDVIEITGKRSTPAIAMAAYAEDESLDVIRLDGLQRGNAEVGSGEHVRIVVAESRPATRVVFAPAQREMRLQGPGQALKRNFFRRPVVAGDLVATTGQQPVQNMPPDVRQLLRAPAYALTQIRLSVVSTVPKGIVHIDESTEVELRAEFEEPRDARAVVNYDDVGGMSDTIQALREMVELPLRYPELFTRLGVDPPKGVLLHGPPGTGKTRLAQAVANESDATFFTINGPEIMGSGYGDSEKALREVFENAAKSSPAIIFIDEIDSIAPKRDRVGGEAEKRLVAQLLTLMDGLEARANLVVIAATNRPDAIDEALRRPGRFDREIVIGVPDESGRREILSIHTRGMPLEEKVDLGELARTTHGFVGADLAALTREAAIDAVRRIMPKLDLDERTIPPEVLEELCVTRKDFVEALKRVQPSAMREVMVQMPRVSWSDIGGVRDAIDKLKEGIELPMKNPEAFARLGIRPAKGFLLYGPPGTGKTLLAKAVAKEAEANFISMKSSDLLSKWYGESEQQIARMFKRARAVAPCVIFIDEIDSLVPARGSGQGEPQVTGRVVNTILAELDGLEELQSIVVIGATNRPGLIDPALLRPGRFDELVYVGTPDQLGREHILEIHTKSMPLAKNVDLSKIAAQTERFTGADLEDVVRRAGLNALRRVGRDVREVAMEDFSEALKDSRATVTPRMEAEYRKMSGELKKRAKEVQQIGFVHEGMVESTRASKHGSSPEESGIE